MKIVIKIGGSLCIDENGPKIGYFKRLLPVLEQVKSKNQLIVAIGGGKFIRKYYNNIKKFNLSDEEMEWIAVDLLRVNVRFLAFLLKTKPVFSLPDLNEVESGVIGGIEPGRSSDANAAIAAEKVNADIFIKLTDVDGIYDKDPKKHKDAKKLGHVKFADVLKYAEEGKPGQYGVLDKMCLEIIKRSRIKAYVINGEDPRNILKVLEGKKIGTVISE